MRRNDYDKVSNIAKQLLDNLNEISSEIDREFEKRTESIVQYVSVYMCRNFGSRAEEISKFEWERGWCPYDHSGELRRVGRLPNDITLEEVFEEYTGRWEPTFESGRGKNWKTILDDLHYETLDVGEKIMWSVLNPKIAAIDDSLDSDESWELNDIIHDEFYDNTKTGNYFWGPDFPDDILKMRYNDFIELSSETREELKNADFKFNYENFYNEFYA